jgi:hypothetical protein
MSRSAPDQPETLCADILAQIRRAENKEETARGLDRVSTEELQATLASVITSRDYFMRNDFAAAYGDKSEKVLAAYHQLYGGQGFDKFIAIDDCDLAKFTIAVSAATAPQDAPGSAVSAVSRAARAPVPIVEGSCRKLMGTLLVTCKPNAVGGTYTGYERWGVYRGQRRLW